MQLFDAIPNKRKTKGRVFIYRLYAAFSLKALRHGSHSFTCKEHHACFYLVSVHQMAPPLNVVVNIIYRPREDERLGWPCWLTYSGRLTHISGHPSATGRVQDGERTLARD